MVVYPTVIIHSISGRSISFFSYSNRFSGFREVLRKREVYGGTFPMPSQNELNRILA